MLQRKRKLISKGFTLVELLVVISIIGLMSATVLAALNSARDKAQHAATLALMRQYLNAVAFAYDANGEYPDPGNINWYCIGDYSDNAGCGHTFPSGSWAYTENVSLQNALSPHIPGLPVIPDFSTNVSGNTYYFRSPMYHCTGRTPGGICVTATLEWYMKGEGKKCLSGVTAIPFVGTTLCLYIFNQ